MTGWSNEKKLPTIIRQQLRWLISFTKERDRRRVEEIQFWKFSNSDFQDVSCQNTDRRLTGCGKCVSLTDVLYKSTMVLMDSPMANNLPHKMGPALGQKEKKSPIENRILGALRPRTENPFSIHAPHGLQRSFQWCGPNDSISLSMSGNRSINHWTIVTILLQISHISRSSNFLSFWIRRNKDCDKKWLCPILTPILHIANEHERGERVRDNVWRQIKGCLVELCLHRVWKDSWICLSKLKMLL